MTTTATTAEVLVATTGGVGAERGTKGGMEGGTEGGRDGRREGGREGGREREEGNKEHESGRCGQLTTNNQLFQGYGIQLTSKP